MHNDAAFVKDATNLQIDVDPVTPEEMKQIIDDLFATPESLRSRARSYFEQKK